MSAFTVRVMPQPYPRIAQGFYSPRGRFGPAILARGLRLLVRIGRLQGKESFGATSDIRRFAMLLEREARVRRIIVEHVQRQVRGGGGVGTMMPRISFLATKGQKEKLRPLCEAARIESARPQGRFAIIGQAYLYGHFDGPIELRFALVNGDEFDVLQRAVRRVKKMMEKRGVKS